MQALQRGLIPPLLVKEVFMFEAEISKNEGGFFVTMDELFDNPEELLTAIGLDGVEFIHENFRNQQFGKKGSLYKERAVPNKAGIWQDIEDGKFPSSGRLDSGPVLRDTGELLKSMTFRIQGETVFIGTNKSYAKRLQEGGTIVKVKTASDFDDRIDSFIQRYHGQMNEEEIHKVNQLKSLSQLSVTVPARKFIGYTTERLNEVFDDFMEVNYGN